VSFNLDLLFLTFFVRCRWRVHG